MPAILDAPIPGESLTREPGNAPWEQPPQYNTPQEALAFYLEKFQDEDQVEDILFMFEQGAPISVFVESLTTCGVMEGIHTIDVSMLISPILHEYFRTMCETAGIKYVEEDGPTPEEKKKMKERQRMAVLINKMIDEDDMPSEEALMDMMPPEAPAPEAAPEAAPANGLIPRRGA